jgi:hypothetical protein
MKHKPIQSIVIQQTSDATKVSIDQVKSGSKAVKNAAYGCCETYDRYWIQDDHETKSERIKNEI